MSKYQALQTKLKSRRAELLERLDEIEHNLDQPMSNDVEDRSVEREDDEVMESLGLSGKSEVQQIDAALQRMEKFEYGECVTCGSEISMERLEAVPTTPFCRDCVPK